MSLSVREHLRSLLGPDTRLDDVEQFIYNRATSGTRELADTLLDKIIAYLDAAGTRDYVAGSTGAPNSDRDTEVRDRYLQVLGAADRLDRATTSESIIVTTVGDIKRLVTEEQFRGVPEHAIREATRKYVADIRLLLRRHVEQTRNSEVQAKDVLEKAEETFTQLEEELNTVTDENLWNLIQRI